MARPKAGAIRLMTFAANQIERSELVGLPAEAQKRGPPSLALQASADSLREQIERRLVSPEGIEASTNRLRDFARWRSRRRKT